ncbi:MULTISPECIES: chemotaxis protein CheA [Clostridium]|uniref:Chemotaxis protein CheA n=1 Tax=Clostridium novyi (strain NT) TaxID=386415 RepID=A0PZY5_CLONN|nr:MULTISPECIES: chemotaxis protein CheA [Clostridium]ABK61648.1 chemotaxis protein cheA [Clostridium novyi NT]KEH88363.1 chemotaxis protein CheA [Clostridium novyi A str. NCTC 538]KEH88707.1 chemotaxis protein CheA [Clostridium novyi A str. 4540]KEH94330.1 chemotaxis protein CheA [Clostridium botulinum C/D str. It1]KEH95027.1 chemotaxis protein CheA [Clostridium novyi A str. GD211209]
MDTSQYLSMFLEESIDNLQTLNESLLELEQDPNNIDKLNEIFRVAHTIKGMAATMGFNEMAELTHKMEDVLSQFREGNLKVTQEVVTVLFKCLDTLEQMVNNISEGVDEVIEVDHIIEKLEAIAEGNSDEKSEENKSIVEESVDTDNKQEESEFKKQINEYDLNVIKQAVDKGFNAFYIKVILNENTLLKSARAFLIFKSLEECGEIIKCMPSADDLENENFDFEIEMVYLTTKNKEEIYEILIDISEVDEVIVDNVSVNTQEKEAQNDIKDEVKPKEKEEEFEETVKKQEVKKPEGKKQQAKSAEPKKRRKVHQSVRVDLERLDKFMNMVSELVIHRTRLEQISSNYRSAELNETLEQVARTTSDLQDLVMKIRMLPLETVFNRFPRMVRDLSVELDKDIDFIIKGQDTELDRTVIDEIGEPLIHLIRNAADHGIESREERSAAGKNTTGTIKLIAYQEGTKAIIKVQDDGGGIDVEKVRAKANKIGINTEGMSEDDIKNLIFAQGFSTNEVVTDVSGRGVGMDVVKTKISSLGGTVDVMSEEGKGSTFTITLPLTLQIIQALLVKIGSETMAISLGYIDRVIDFKENNVMKTDNKEVIVYNDNVIPLVRVSEKLGLEKPELSKQYIVIVKVGGKTVGLLVDGLLGQQETVIKPLGKTLKGLKEYIGATIYGDGLVTLILDVAALI